MSNLVVTSPTDFDYLQIGLASPDRIRFWSHGEVEKPETINYRTFKPERKGLFCEKIFGPVKDWECSCGKYRRVRYRGIVCERCGVQVTHSKVRRERMGHLELAAPVSHIWFLKGIPSYMGLVLDMTSRQLEEVIYYDSYIVTDVNNELSSELAVKQQLSIPEYSQLKEKYGDKFKADIGARAIKTLLQAIDLEKLVAELRESLEDSKGQKRLKAAKRLRVAEALLKSGNRPEWMIMDVVPVMPPDLRPMVQLEGGRFATSDLNDLYRRVVNRNNRLKRLIDIGAPDMIVRNEKRMLQEAVDVLISNGKRGRSVTGSNGRPLKSLGSIIEGKQGRFRQNLLGKRVDYSGRSVIVVGPRLKFHQCGLPKEMALELFKPFVIQKLVERNHVTNVKSAKRMIERRMVVVWDVLEEVIAGQTVLLNRAPTLHRLGIQAFEPILVEGSAIQVHPLVCTAFNADFDGDQMAVHVPLSLEAQAECRFLIMSTNNILAPSNGRSIVTATQDMILGLYFLTVDNPDATKGRNKIFYTKDEVMRAWDAKVIDFQSEIQIKIEGKLTKTTLGRVIFNTAIQETIEKFNKPVPPFINHTVGKKQLSDYILKWFSQYGTDVTGALVDRLKTIGFKYATLSGISISIDDLKIPDNKKKILDRADKEILKLNRLEKDGKITSEDKVFQSNDIWRHATTQISNQMANEFGQLNNVFIMANSGARGNIDQVRQLAGMRGLMSDAQGRTIDVPIKANFKEGLSLTEYFISSYGARKGLVDTALRTADSGYLTRRLVDIAQDVMITEEDCGATEGAELREIKEGVTIIVHLAEVIEGRYSLQTLKEPKAKEPIVREGDLITMDIAKRIEAAGVESFKVRSVYKCQTQRGLCQKCYGMDLSSGKPINLGEAVGIIAAQSIGEPGTQLTMRTFHTGGVDLRKSSKVHIESDSDGMVEMEAGFQVRKVTNTQGEAMWVTIEDGHIYVNGKNIKDTHFIPKWSTVFVKPNDKVKVDDLIAEYDPSYEYIQAEIGGSIKFMGIQLHKRKDENGQTSYFSKNEGEIYVYQPEKAQEFKVNKSFAEKYKLGERLKVGTDIKSDMQLDFGGMLLEVKATKSQHMAVICPCESYPIQSEAQLFIEDGQKILDGELLAREHISDTDAAKTKDIVQGLPRVEELFEARKPKDACVLSEVDGVVEIANRDGLRIISVIGSDSRKEYKIPAGTRLKVYSGKKVAKGDQLTEGQISPHDILQTKGVQKTQLYLSDEIQRVYRSQGVSINIKHIEVIVRQMTRKVNILSMGSSVFLPNELIDTKTFEAVNQEMKNAGKEPAEAERVLLGITRASLNTESFISASSFQETARVLADAAVKGKKDEMYGLKENVIIGKLIPAGTGLQKYRNIGLKLEEGITEEVNLEEELLEITS